jgi:hypothetical protein
MEINLRLEKHHVDVILEALEVARSVIYFKKETSINEKRFRYTIEAIKGRIELL